MGNDLSKDFLISEFWRWVKDHNGKIPGKDEILASEGYPSTYQFQKVFNIKRWNFILKEIGVKPSSENWEEKDINFLKNNYNNLDDEEIGKILGKTKNGVVYKRSDLGLRRKSKKIKWGKWEIDYLKNNFYNTTQKEICEKLYPRKWETIRAFATKRLKLKRKHRLYKYQTGSGFRICKKCKKVLKENEENFYKENKTFKTYCKKCWSELHYEEMYGENFKEVHFELYKNLYDLNNQKWDSIAEKIITNWFIENNINYIKHPSYCKYIDNDKTQRKFDWIITIDNKNYFVEYFGLWNTESKNKYLEKYTKSAKKKIKTLYKSGLINRCIFIFPKNFKYKKIDEIFADVLLNKSNSFEKPLVVNL